jgi:hypothetical protein
MYGFENLCSPRDISHHGILGQKWGVRNGPPYPLKGGSYSGRLKTYHRKDEKITSKNKVVTLSYDKDRTKKSGYFYANTKHSDVKFYARFFNKKIKDIETGKTVRKYKITNRFVKNAKIAGEDTGIKVFSELFKKDRNFYNYVTDEKRMQSRFVYDKYKFRGYKKVKPVYKKIKDGEQLTGEDVSLLYRIYNYTLPNEDSDTVKNRELFFTELKKHGYSGVTDTNDRYYGGFKKDTPVIIFDMESVIPEQIRRTRLIDMVI